MDDLSFVNKKVTECFGWTAQTLAEEVKPDNYGYQWPSDTIQWVKEAYAYRQSPRGSIERFNHMVNMIKLDLPDFVFTSQGYINDECLRVLKALCDYSDLGIAGAASSGKTFPVAAYRLENWKSCPHKTLDFVCTTSLGAAEQRIWGAIVNLFQHSHLQKGFTYIPHKHAIVFGRFSEDADQRDFRAAIIALAIEKGNEGRKAIDTTRGRKQENVSITFDELPEMESYVTLALINLEANDNLEATYIGNPFKKTDAHGEALKPDHPLGYDSINQNTREWKTRTGHAIFLNGEWSANFQAPPGDKPPFRGIIDRYKVARILKRCHGNKNSLEYWRNAIGFWPNVNIGKTVLSKDLIITSKAYETTKWRDPAAVRKNLCALDPGFTFGGDACVAEFGEIGFDEKGKKTLRWLFERIYEPNNKEVFEESIAKQVVEDLIKYNVDPDCFGLDISSDGGKILREIIRIWLATNRNAANIVPISSMGLPSERIFSSVDPRPCKEVFDRRVTEYWMMVREGVLCQVLNGLPLFADGNEQNEMIEQLCTREYEIRGRKFVLETKDDMKTRTNGKSPNNADAYSYLVELGRRHGLMFTAAVEEKHFERTKIVRRRFRQQYQEAYSSNSWGEGD